MRDSHVKKLHANLKPVLNANDKPGRFGFGGLIELPINKQSDEQQAHADGEESCSTDHLPLLRRPKNESSAPGNASLMI
jgi:hypothetical protein